MRIVTVHNPNEMAMGFRDKDGIYHVASSGGGRVVLEPSVAVLAEIVAFANIGILLAVFSDTPVFLGDVVIEGNARIGETLSARVGVVGSDTVVYQWEIAGVPVEDEIGPEFVVPEGSEEQWVTVVAKAVNSSGETVSVSDQFGPVESEEIAS